MEEAMEEVVKFLTENPTFYLATVESGRAKVRPFGVFLVIDGKISLVTNNKKAVYRQMIANSWIELAVTAANGSFLRVGGRAERITTDENKQRFLDAFPPLEPFYGGGNFKYMEVISIADAYAEIQKLDGTRRELAL
jgi:uncharacterized pyridoxamine 5'-phosphate oxidase family protein